LVHRSEFNSLKEAYMNDAASGSDSRAFALPIPVRHLASRFFYL